METSSVHEFTNLHTEPTLTWHDKRTIYLSENLEISYDNQPVIN